MDDMSRLVLLIHLARRRRIPAQIGRVSNYRGAIKRAGART